MRSCVHAYIQTARRYVRTNMQTLACMHEPTKAEKLIERHTHTHTRTHAHAHQDRPPPCQICSQCPAWILEGDRSLSFFKCIHSISTSGLLSWGHDILRSVARALLEPGVKGSGIGFNLADSHPEGLRQGSELRHAAPYTDPTALDGLVRHCETHDA